MNLVYLYCEGGKGEIKILRVGQQIKHSILREKKKKYGKIHWNPEVLPFVSNCIKKII